MNLFDDIKTGLGQAIDFEKGNLKAKTTTVSLPVKPIESFKPEEIRSIRLETGMTQNCSSNIWGYLRKQWKPVKPDEIIRREPLAVCFLCREMIRLFLKDPVLLPHLQDSEKK